MSRTFQKIVLPLSVVTLFLASSCLPWGGGGPVFGPGQGGMCGGMMGQVGMGGGMMGPGMMGGQGGAAEGRGAGPEQQSTAALLPRGAQLYGTYCLACHGGASGGQMKDIPPRHNGNGHTWDHPDCQLVDTVLSGSGETAPRMPAFTGQLTADDVKAILAHIKTWWTEEERQAQARLTQRQCN